MPFFRCAYDTAAGNRRLASEQRGSASSPLGDQWLRLEADPTLLCLCERPSRLSAASGSRLIDFWVQRNDGERLLLVDDGQGGIPLQRVAAAELAVAAIWIDNWQRMLPTIISTRAWLSGALARSVQEYVREPMALSRLERAFAMGSSNSCEAAA